jgi:exodeoxyribonuclease V alpha subunit
MKPAAPGGGAGKRPEHPWFPLRRRHHLPVCIVRGSGLISPALVPPSNAHPPSASLTGVVERIIFLNEENHYTIAEFRPESSAAEAPTPAPVEKKAPARPELVTIVGALPGVECGETLHLRGEWTRHAQHGAQFKIAGFKSELPASVYGIRKYLGSGLVPGIGKVYANKIVDAFGTDTFRILSEESGRLRDVEGIGKKRATAIKQAWDSKRTERELYIFLQTYGVTPSQCLKLVKHYGADAKRILTTEPYKVAREIDGIGFKTADKIAINVGFANDAPPRLDAGILYALETLQEEGHTAFREADLIDYTANLLETDSKLLEARIGALVESTALIRHDVQPHYVELQTQNPKLKTQNPPPLPGSGLLQLPHNDRAEQKIAAAVSRLIRSGSGLPPIKVDAAVEWAEKKAGFAFHELQRVSVRNALSHKVTILTGGPGTGKTTILRALVEILNAKKVRVHLAAPTGRAAQRLAETAGGFASTIHRLLKYDASRGGFTANEQTPLATDFLVLDEASMLDTRLAAALLQAVPARAHLLLVGDTDQLPSVGAGNVLKDLIACGSNPQLSAPGSALPASASRLSTLNPQLRASQLSALSSQLPAPVSQPSTLNSQPVSRALPVTRLSVIYRQQGQSQIVTTAHAINAGDPSLPPVVPEVAAAQVASDLNFIAATDAEDCLRKVQELVTEFIPRVLKWPHAVNDVQILAPMHKGVAGVGNLNAQLQATLNGHTRGLRAAGGEFRPGDKVIQLRNNYDKNLFNGDIGTVVAIDGEKGTLDAEFDRERHTFERGELGELALAYAISIHKSQGSEYPVVIIPLLKGHFMMLQRNLLYTAITRGKKKVFIVGETAAYAMAVRNSESKQRVTHLREKIVVQI